MRDILVSGAILGFLPFALLHPWIGVLLWTWVSVMNPHKLAYGFASELPWAAAVAGTTLIGLVLTRDRRSFPITPITVVLILLLAWMTVTSMFALVPAAAWVMWDKVSKIFLMLLVTLLVLHTRRHIEWLIWVTVGSVAYFALKGGLFTFLTGGGFRVYGPPGSFIEENNALGLATVVCIPLINYVRLGVNRPWLRMALLGAMIVCGASVLGSHSRGGLLAIAAMVLFLWWRGKNKVVGLVAFLCLIPPLIAFMPDDWTMRMDTMRTYEEDASAMSRLRTWAMILNLVADRPTLGGGFAMYTKEVYARWAPDAENFVAHSIYFQMLGEHGVPGLALYLLLWLFAWRTAGWIRTQTRSLPEYQWAYWLASMSQVSFVGFAAGGAFLSLAYFDVPYNFIIALVLTRKLIEKELAARRETTNKAVTPAGTGRKVLATRSGFGAP